MQFHYDLSNDFYGLFLGPTMAYTCAYWPRPETTLDEAQTAKFDMICRKLRLQPGERLLDIGSAGPAWSATPRSITASPPTA